ncbi:hypothetical protein NIGALANA_180 [Bacillus phage Nigalana]|nr:hypothetical protein BI005_gp180 [Bacillus phage Nigalana]AMW61330.1 hypothetical protein NIGALANA_180 [Bacillus phage Nigalana]ASR78960.1 hypothetical protein AARONPHADGERS_183 [Bacillus phage AaronPhadgers]
MEKVASPFKQLSQSGRKTNQNYKTREK